MTKIRKIRAQPAATTDATPPTVPPPATNADTPPAVAIPPTLATVAAAVGVDVAGSGSDLLRIDDDSRARCLGWLADWATGATWADAAARHGLQPFEVQSARRHSATFASLMDAADDLRRASAVRAIEDTLTTTGRGAFARREGYYPPDVRAAQLFLAASSDRYKPGAGAVVPPVAIQINI